MKKIFVLILTLVIAVVFLSAASREENKPEAQQIHKKPASCGYTIIEFGKAIDCNGDTVALIKNHGHQSIASNYNEHSKAVAI